MIRIETWFSPHSERAQEFFGPAISGFVGCAVFAVFDRFGIGNISEGGSSRALIHETAKSFESPFVLLATFLFALALVTNSSDGRNALARWLIAPFMRLAQHVMMLGLGVFLALAISELPGKGPTLQWFAQVVWTSFCLTFFAYVCSIGVSYCRGKYWHRFEKRRGRQLLAAVLGIVFAVFGAVDLVRYAHTQSESQPKPGPTRGHDSH